MTQKYKIVYGEDKKTRFFVDYTFESAREFALVFIKKNKNKYENMVLYERNRKSRGPRWIKEKV